MNKTPLFFIVAAFLLSSCGTTNMIKTPKGTAYGDFYAEQPKSILVLPPVNNSTAANAKDLLRTTIAPVLAEKGYYVIPIEPVFDFMKLNGAYSIAETTEELPLDKFQELFGADAVLKITVNGWDKKYAVVSGSVEVSLTYDLISTKSKTTLWSRTKVVEVNTTSSSGGGGLIGLVADVVVTAAATASTKYVTVAEQANIQAIRDMPAGYYNPMFNKDQSEIVLMNAPESSEK